MNRKEHSALLPSCLNDSHLLLWHVPRQTTHFILSLILSSKGDIVSIMAALCKTNPLCRAS